MYTLCAFLKSILHYLKIIVKNKIENIFTTLEQDQLDRQENPTLATLAHCHNFQLTCLLWRRRIANVYTPSMPYFLLLFFTFCLFLVDFLKMKFFYSIPLKSSCLFFVEILKMNGKKKAWGVYNVKRKLHKLLRNRNILLIILT